MSPTRNVPRSFIRRMPSSSISVPCSMESKPARVASLMLCVPCACAAMRRPALCASSAATREYAAAGGDLDHVDAVLDVRADHVAELVGAVGDVEVALERVQVDADV